MDGFTYRGSHVPIYVGLKVVGYSIEDHAGIGPHEENGEFAKEMPYTLPLLLSRGPGQGLGKPSEDSCYPILLCPCSLHDQGEKIV